MCHWHRGIGYPNANIHIFKEYSMEKEINLDDVTKYLSRAFSKAAAKAAESIGSRALRTKDKRSGTWETTPMYDYQVEFCYLINNIQHGPRYISTKSIQWANELIAKLEIEGS